jgi:putative endonuclease
VKSGGDAEDAAACYLSAQGLEIIARNYRCRFGEIDLIARDGKTLVFVEVRHRSSASFGGAAESITPAKRAKLVATAQHYLATRKPTECRFDTVLLQGNAPILWLRNAFGA